MIGEELLKCDDCGRVASPGRAEEEGWRQYVSDKMTPEGRETLLACDDCYYPGHFAQMIRQSDP